jgi:hypothetical protein
MVSFSIGVRKGGVKCGVVGDVFSFALGRDYLLTWYVVSALCHETRGFAK